ncbi:antirestriction protein ArdC [Rhodoblastus acidophilus]|uniref:ArdC family protein n=1 Tax=Rhodoblastus acidophilus TaxID=1074 RepID=UPI0022240832|nr:zincin-like metallopeptidase domain-containing protein [Rhodoblastus acidophilus]MCW2283171.1 antirestriction protein ArdC [Rhodoblastus acidophilus]MCW2332031.1 antirestriction protein ArdC [Rhodoblastus acidophilus]
MMKAQHFDIHQSITDTIIVAIERGAGEFQLPWHRSAGSAMRPTNIDSKKRYRGVNVVALWAISDQHGYSSGLWGTYRQWAEAGAQVRKGEKAAYVAFYKEIAVTDEEDRRETRLIARASPVFAAEQVDGYAAPTPDATTSPMTPIEQAEAFVSHTGAVIQHGGDRAFYRPATDQIALPVREAFVGTPTISPAEAYYATAFHELTHWTGHESRCNRQLGKRFGDAAYAAEELVAELGAAFLCADVGVSAEPRLDHAQYLDHWLRLMRADKRAIFTAAAKASEAVAYLTALQGG